MELTNTEVTILEDDMGLEVRTGYSGRGMYGDTGRVDELNVIIGKVARANTDSLGRDSIVIY